MQNLRSSDYPMNTPLTTFKCASAFLTLSFPGFPLEQAGAPLSDSQHLLHVSLSVQLSHIRIRYLALSGERNAMEKRNPRDSLAVNEWMSI